MIANDREPPASPKEKKSGLLRRTFMTDRQFEAIFQAEALQGERIHWYLNWALYGMVLVLAGAVFFLQHRAVGMYGMVLAGVNLVYNALIAVPIFKGRVLPQVRYLSVTLNTATLTVYTYFDAVQNSSLAPATTAALLLYPVLIFIASLRMDKALIAYTTLLGLLSMNGLYFWFYPQFDPVVAPQIVSADILGQVYRSVYLLVCGIMMYTVPLTMRRILLTQETLAHESMMHKLNAELDPLTGIANRRGLDQGLARATGIAKATDSTLALFYMDLDGFKELNDTLGHDAGDDMLRAIVSDIGNVIRPCDLVARMGGDEFVILMHHPVDAEDAAHFARRLLDTVSRNVEGPAGSIRITASLGVSLFPEDAVEPEKLIRCADEAMYQVKRAGKAGYAFSKPMV